MTEEESNQLMAMVIHALIEDGWKCIEVHSNKESYKGTTFIFKKRRKYMDILPLFNAHNSTPMSWCIEALVSRADDCFYIVNKKQIKELIKYVNGVY